MRDTTELISISRNSTLATVIDVIRDTFNHEARTGWTVFKLKEPLSEEDYLDMRRNHLQALTTMIRKLEESAILRNVLEFPTSNNYVTLVAVPESKFPNDRYLEHH